MTIKRTVINLVLFFHLGTLLDETLNALLPLYAPPNMSGCTSADKILVLHNTRTVCVWVDTGRFWRSKKKHVFCVSSKILVIFYYINLLNTHSGFFMFICMRRSLQWYSNNTERNPRLFNMPLKNIVQHVCSTFFNKKMIYHLRWLFVLVSVENENLRTRNGHESP